MRILRKSSLDDQQIIQLQVHRRQLESYQVSLADKDTEIRKLQAALEQQEKIRKQNERLKQALEMDQDETEDLRRENQRLMREIDELKQELEDKKRRLRISLEAQRSLVLERDSV